MSQSKADVSVAKMMHTIDSGVEYTIDSTRDGHIHIETPSSRTVLTLDEAKDVLSPASSLRPDVALNSPPIDTFETELYDTVRDALAAPTPAMPSA